MTDPTDTEVRPMTGKTARAIAKTEREQRRAHIAVLLMKHWTYAEISREIGVSQGTVTNDVACIRRNWRERAGAAYDILVAEETAKLDALEREVLPKALAGNKEDGGPSLWAVDRALAIMDRRARLLGLDRPVKAQMQVNVTAETQTDRDIRDLLDQITTADAARPA